LFNSTTTSPLPSSAPRLHAAAKLSRSAEWISRTCGHSLLTASIVSLSPPLSERITVWA
jgi:hypothetical protein